MDKVGRVLKRWLIIVQYMCVYMSPLIIPHFNNDDILNMLSDFLDDMTVS